MGWINGSDASRFFGYTLPAAKAYVSGDWFAKRLAEIEADAAKLKSDAEASSEGSFARRALPRRLESLRRSHQNHKLQFAHQAKIVEVGRRIKAKEVSFSRAFDVFDVANPTTES